MDEAMIFIFSTSMLRIRQFFTYKLTRKEKTLYRHKKNGIRSLISVPYQLFFNKTCVLRDIENFVVGSSKQRGSHKKTATEKNIYNQNKKETA